MDIKVLSSQLNGEIIAPPSKSYAHRLIIGAFLSGEKTIIKNVGFAHDVKATLGAVKALGANVEYIGRDVQIIPGTLPSSTTINCIESGSTLRFMLSVVSGLGVNTKFVGSERLLSRPIEKLTSCLGKHGVTISNYQTNGKLTSGNYEIDATISSQYITGLLLILPLLDGDSTISMLGNVVSFDYIKITLDVLDKFSIKYKIIDNGILVYGNQKYLSPKELTVEGDYSNCAFFISSAIISGKITIHGLNEQSIQGDKEIINIAKRFGAKVTFTNGSLTVEHDKINHLNIITEDIPDLCQTLSVVSAFASGTTTLIGVNRLNLKESDRCDGIISNLTKFGISAQHNDNTISITGGEAHPTQIDPDNDHRTAMSNIIMASKVGNTIIKNVECMSKSYPNFLEDFEKLGGKYNVEV